MSLLLPLEGNAFPLYGERKHRVNESQVIVSLPKSMFAQDVIAKFMFLWLLEKLVNDDR